MSIKVLLFDMDGTLVDHNELMPDVLNQTLKDFGLDVKIEKLLCSGKTDFHNFKYYLNQCGHPVELQDETAAMLCQKMVQKTVDLIPVHGMDACPGVLPMLKEMDRLNYVMGLLTGNVKRVAPPKLKAAGIDPGYFKFGAYGDESESRSEIAAIAIERARKYTGNSLHPSQVLIIGDTPRDVACARDVGAASLAVATGEFSKEELMASEPDFYLDDFTRLQTFIDMLF